MTTEQTEEGQEIEADLGEVLAHVRGCPTADRAETRNSDLTESYRVPRLEGAARENSPALPRSVFRSHHAAQPTFK